MTGEIPTRYGMESRPSRSNIHLLHPSKTDEIEVLESGAINHHNHTNIGNGIADHSRTKVSTQHIHISHTNSKNFHFKRILYIEFEVCCSHFFLNGCRGAFCAFSCFRFTFAESRLKKRSNKKKRKVWKFILKMLFDLCEESRICYFHFDVCNTQF